MDVSQVVTQAEAARRLGLKANTVAGLIAQGRIKTLSTADGLRLVPLAEIERYKKTKRPAGRPPKE